MSSNADAILAAAHYDAYRFGMGNVDLKNIGEGTVQRVLVASN